MVQQLNKNNMTQRLRLKSNSLLIASLVALSTLSFPAVSDEQEEAESAERWFEIEVILVEQLMNKDRYNEDFSVENSHSNKTKSIDLINQHLNNILSYKQQLTPCDSSALQAHVQKGSSNDVSTESLKNQLANVEQNITCTPYKQSDFINPMSEQLTAIPRRLGNIEDVYANTPYLIEEKNLQLSDIVKSLRRSREFRPLLHMAWRQAVVARTEAVPVKLIAGDNFALKQQNKQLKSEHLLTQSLTIIETEPALNLTLGLDESTELDTELTQAQQEDILIKQHLNSIIEKLQLTEENSLQIGSDNIISEIERGDTKPIIAKADAAEIMNEDDIKPGWFIDGLFKVHLDHYLYINSEFNVFTQVKDTPTSKAKSLLVPFKQNRRVISGEIHYFDHPYMGMIVQIRRHERPEPDVEFTPPNDEDVIDSENASLQTTH